MYITRSLLLPVLLQLHSLSCLTHIFMPMQWLFGTSFVITAIHLPKNYIKTGGMTVTMCGPASFSSCWQCVLDGDESGLRRTSLLPQYLLHIFATLRAIRLCTDLPSPRNTTLKCWWQLEVHPFGNPSSSRHPDVCVEPVTALQTAPFSHKSADPADRRTFPCEKQYEELKSRVIFNMVNKSIPDWLSLFIFKHS